MDNTGARFELFDLLDLLLLYAAKLGRGKLSASADAGHREFYETFFTANDREVLVSGRDPRRIWRQDLVNAAIREHVDERSAIWDIGCGLGDNLEGMQAGRALFGVEYSTASARSAARRLGTRAAIVVASASKLPVPDASVEAVTCLEVIEHLADDRAAIAELARILKPGGIAIVSAPYRYWFRQYLPLMGHYRHYTRESLRGLLESEGMRIVAFLPNCPGWTRRINYAYVTCRILSLLARLAGRRTSPIDVRLPGASTPLYVQLSQRLAARLEREMAADYSKREDATFLVVRRG